MSTFKYSGADLRNFRYRHELKLETSARNSQYTSRLIDMMRKEEYLLQQIQRLMRESSTQDSLQVDNSRAMNQAKRELTNLAQSIETALSNETAEFFRKIATKNKVDWKAFEEKFRSSSVSQIEAANENGVPLSPEQVLEKEISRLDRDYNKNWYKYEAFHLQRAFESQKSRISNDFRVQLLDLKADYEARKNEIKGTLNSESRIYSISRDSDSQTDSTIWHHEEKQKMLFNTVPVLLPSPTKGKSKRQGEQAKQDVVDKVFNFF